jgi:hypothetical protein
MLTEISSFLSPKQRQKLMSTSKEMKKRLYDIYSYINDNNIQGFEEAILKLPKDELLKFILENPNVNDNTFGKILDILIVSSDPKTIIKEITKAMINILEIEKSIQAHLNKDTDLDKHFLNAMINLMNESDKYKNKTNSYIKNKLKEKELANIEQKLQTYKNKFKKYIKTPVSQGRQIYVRKSDEEYMYLFLLDFLKLLKTSRKTLFKKINDAQSEIEEIEECMRNEWY